MTDQLKRDIETLCESTRNLFDHNSCTASVDLASCRGLDKLRKVQPDSNYAPAHEVRNPLILLCVGGRSRHHRKPQEAVQCERTGCWLSGIKIVRYR